MSSLAVRYAMACSGVMLLFDNRSIILSARGLIKLEVA